jgi:retron-type reverse transcriptase
MALWGLLERLLVRAFRGSGHGVAELARRLGVSVQELRSVEPVYRPFTIPKRSGGTRQILAPDERLKALQRRILRRLLRRLRCHPAAAGFERGRSIVTNALPHLGKPVIVRLDLKDFFVSTRAARVRKYFRTIGWDREAAWLLTRLCTHGGGLPQGAPTSPRLSNLVNHRLDARLAGLAAYAGPTQFRNPRTGGPVVGPQVRVEATYTRYADDLTFSFDSDDPKRIHDLIWRVRRIVEQEGYTLHLRKKLSIRRRHQRQVVTGLVVNERVNLPRATRRWLRAVEHRLARGEVATLTPAQFAGWRALRHMNDAQAARGT